MGNTYFLKQEREKAAPILAKLASFVKGATIRFPYVCHPSGFNFAEICKKYRKDGWRRIYTGEFFVKVGDVDCSRGGRAGTKAKVRRLNQRKDGSFNLDLAKTLIEQYVEEKAPMIEHETRRREARHISRRALDNLGFGYRNSPFEYMEGSAFYPLDDSYTPIVRISFYVATAKLGDMLALLESEGYIERKGEA